MRRRTSEGLRTWIIPLPAVMNMSPVAAGHGSIQEKRMRTMQIRRVGTGCRAPCLGLGAAGAIAVAPPAPVRSAIRVQKAPAVILQFTQSISSRTAAVGDTVRLRVYSDVIVGGRTLIHEDTPAVGIVDAISQPGRFGRKAR